MRGKILIAIILLASSCLTDELGESPESQLARQREEIEAYLTAHPPNPAFTTVRDESGITLVIEEGGPGIVPPNSGNNLKVAYTGRLLSNGAIFDSNEAFFVKLSSAIIQGWKNGLALMTEGTHAKLYIPAVLAYGKAGQGSIPANANLVFDLHLIDVVPTAQQTDQLTADTTAIDAYLEANNIVAQKHESGVRYVINTEGSGETPILYDLVKIKFKATGLTDNEVIVDGTFEPQAGFSSRVVNYPHGAIVGLHQMKEGGKATFYVPSGLVYGLNGAPPNTNVKIEIELLDVIR